MGVNVAPTKRTKRTALKATLEHVTGSTGRDGAFDFASKTEILDRMSGQKTVRAANRRGADFKKKAELCAELAASATEAGVRLSYEELARAWAELADETEKLTTRRKR